MLTLRDSDIRLTFGFQCGGQPLVMNLGPRVPSDFMQRRYGSVSRISSKLVKTLFFDAVRSTSTRDVEDAVKLITLYVCVKLFFSTLEESYFLCEHTSLVVVDRPEVFPRFLKWNVGNLLTRMRNVTLDDVDNFEGDNDFVDRVNMFDDVHMDEKTVDERKSNMNVVTEGVPSGIQVKAQFTDEPPIGRKKMVAETGEGGVRFLTNSDGPSVPDTIQNAQRNFFALESENKSKDFVIAKLKEQVSKLTIELEQQASNMLVGFNGWLKVKEDEIARMTSVISGQRSTITRLEEKLTLSDVNPSGEGACRANTEGETDLFAFGYVENAEEIIHDVT
ncbi:hypothetical protein LOK49_LG12G01098 [Camellia lanceoleosa]|uniref:Uncharacterized protein n=1 Tax=Camellia lanceoleosa TaxID=1840588 RepID=A0ACC0FUE0_9ERIC|nr:hypothetical protein LOK49_LG12G01098 [Camellia lanceoleosa]